MESEQKLLIASFARTFPNEHQSCWNSAWSSCFYQWPKNAASLSPFPFFGPPASAPGVRQRYDSRLSPSNHQHHANWQPRRMPHLLLPPGCPATEPTDNKNKKTNFILILYGNTPYLVPESFLYFIKFRGDRTKWKLLVSQFYHLLGLLLAPCVNRSDSMFSYEWHITVFARDHV